MLRPTIRTNMTGRESAQALTLRVNRLALRPPKAIRVRLFEG
jgi:hypothetical protein